jgi:transcriptional regulator with XRE-family HTH domain
MSGTGTGKPERIGHLLARLRKGKGWSQLQLADKLCQVSGRVTLTRHEVSRWERGERVPGRFWLEALAMALETPLEELETAVCATRQRVPGPGARPPGMPWLWRPLVAVDLAAALDHGRAHDLRDLAHAWLTGPPEGWNDPAGTAEGGSPSSGRAATGAFGAAPEPVLLDGTGRDLLGFLETRLTRLRRADDLLGGVELAGRVDRRLREVTPLLTRLGNQQGRLRNRMLRLIAGYAQLAGWVHADAGNALAARRAYRVGLKAATMAADQQLAAHVLGSLSSLSLEAGNAEEALLVARTGLAGPAVAPVKAGTGSERGGSRLLRVLLLHRAALAAARLGDQREPELLLVEAERLADQSKPEDEPEWLYWLDQAEVAAMTGRCLAVLGRPLRAAQLLANRSGGDLPRGSALYGCWLARSYLELGEVEYAESLMERVRVQAAGAGSARAEGALRYLRVKSVPMAGFARPRRYR